MIWKRQLYLEWSADHPNMLIIQGWTEEELNYIRGLNDLELSSMFSLLLSEFVEPFLYENDSIQPISGSFKVESDSVNFISRFNFMSGVNYSFLIKEDLEDSLFETEVWSIERPLIQGTPSTSILGVYPSGSDIPLNLLKI